MPTPILTAPPRLVRRVLGLALSMVGLVVAPACTRGSGTPASETRQTAEFDALDVGGPFQVTVEVGPERHVELRGDDNVISKIRSETVGSTLHLELSGWVVTKLPLEAVITTPALVDLDASGAATVAVTGVTGARFEVDASGASRVSLAGQVTTFEAELSGASALDAAALTAGDADVEASGASKATVRVTGTLRAEASGASTIRYHGPPAQLHQDTSGASKIEPAS